VSEEVNQCRDLVNEPGGVMFPATLAECARRVAARTGLDCTVLDERQLARAAYGGLLAVGRGSIHPPRMIVLRYHPKQPWRRHVALVGKGITFDSGGLSLKPPDGMQAMKGDMAGGAAVIHALAAVARLAPAVRVTGIVPAAENLPGPRAQRPGDIFTAKNGKSVMVNNTDAEGRLVLTDGLARAGEEQATDIVDIATLTQSCAAALGTAVAAVMGNDPGLVERVIRAGKEQGELFWELPLIREYRSMLKTPHADIKNVGGRSAGTLVAGLFLQEFVPDGVPWAHLDINGTFMVERPWKYYQEGATGFGLKTLVELCERFAEH
jgi:leucyl aminopeptidase